MQVKKAVVWWLVRGEDHPSLAEGDKNAQGLDPLIKAMFPGIDYYSITGFSQVMHELVIPALRARHGELRRVATRDARPGEMIEVAEVLPSVGYQWQDDPAWMPRFRQALQH